MSVEMNRKKLKKIKNYGKTLKSVKTNSFLKIERKV